MTNIYKLMFVLRGPSGVGKSSIAKKIEGFLFTIGENKVYFDNKKKKWDVQFFHEKYGVAMTRFFQGRVTAVSWQTICGGFHLNRMIEAMDFLRGATPENPRIVILDRNLEDVAIFSWMASNASDDDESRNRLQNQHVFEDLYQEMGSWYKEAGLKVISIGFSINEAELLKERIRRRAICDDSRRSEERFLLEKDGGANFTRMWQTLMSYTVNMDREFGGIYTLLKCHEKFPNIVWYKIDALGSFHGVFNKFLTILRAEAENKSVEDMLLTPPMFTKTDTSYQNTQRPSESVLLKYYSKYH